MPGPGGGPGDGPGGGFGGMGGPMGPPPPRRRMGGYYGRGCCSGCLCTFLLAFGGIGALIVLLIAAIL